MDVLVPVILRNVDGCVVEIGAGASTSILSRHAEESGATFYSCDNSREKWDSVKSDLEGTHYERSRQFFLHLPSLMFMHFFETRIREPIAVAFIDGCHRYNMTKSEARFFFGKLAEGGVMFLHDTLPPDEKLIGDGGLGEAYMVRQELEKVENADCFTWPYTAGGYGLTMVIKKPKDRPFYRM